MYEHVELKRNVGLFRILKLLTEIKKKKSTRLAVKQMLITKTMEL